MRFSTCIAAGALTVGLASEAARAQMGEFKIGASAATGAANQADYDMGVGGQISAAAEGQAGIFDSRLGLRANFLNYQREGNSLGGDADFQQYGVSLESLFGPSIGIFEPKVGGHVGYMRLGNEQPGEDDNLDLGADVMAAVNITPNLEVQALVSPTWLMNPDDTDYQTRGSLGIELALPGA